MEEGKNVLMLLRWVGVHGMIGIGLFSVTSWLSATFRLSEFSAPTGLSTTNKQQQ
jgi:hypothetical protein